MSLQRIEENRQRKSGQNDQDGQHQQDLQQGKRQSPTGDPRSRRNRSSNFGGLFTQVSFLVTSSVSIVLKTGAMPTPGGRILSDTAH